MRPELRSILDKSGVEDRSLEVIASFCDAASEPSYLETLYRSDDGRYYLLADRDLIEVTLSAVFAWLEGRGMETMTIYVGLDLEGLEVEATLRKYDDK